MARRETTSVFLAMLSVCAVPRGQKQRGKPLLWACCSLPCSTAVLLWTEDKRTLQEKVVVCLGGCSLLHFSPPQKHPVALEGLRAGWYRPTKVHSREQLRTRTPQHHHKHFGNCSINLLFLLRANSKPAVPTHPEPGKAWLHTRVRR